MACWTIGMRRRRYRRRSSETCSFRERPVCRRRPASPRRSTSTRSTKLCTSSSGPSTNSGLDRASSSIAASSASIWLASAAESTPAAASARAHAMLPAMSSSNSRRSKRNEAPNSNASASGPMSKRPDHSVVIVLLSIADVAVRDLAYALVEFHAHDSVYHLLDSVDVGVERSAQQAEPAAVLDELGVLAADGAGKTMHLASRHALLELVVRGGEDGYRRCFELFAATDAVLAGKKIETADQIEQRHSYAVERHRNARLERNVHHRGFAGMPHRRICD